MTEANFNSTLGNKVLVQILAEQHGVDPSLALNIACAESQFVPYAKNRSSTASGMFQFLDSSWRNYGLKHWGTLQGKSKLSAYDNIELAMLMLKSSGSKDWNASKYSGLGGGWTAKPYERGLCGETVLL